MAQSPSSVKENSAPSGSDPRATAMDWEPSMPDRPPRHRAAKKRRIVPTEDEEEAARAEISGYVEEEGDTEDEWLPPMPLSPRKDPQRARKTIAPPPVSPEPDSPPPPPAKKKSQKSQKSQKAPKISKEASDLAKSTKKPAPVLELTQDQLDRLSDHLRQKYQESAPQASISKPHQEKYAMLGPFLANQIAYLEQRVVEMEQLQVMPESEQIEYFQLIKKKAEAKFKALPEADVDMDGDLAPELEAWFDKVDLGACCTDVQTYHATLAMIPSSSVPGAEALRQNFTKIVLKKAVWSN